MVSGKAVAAGVAMVGIGALVGWLLRPQCPACPSGESRVAVLADYDEGPPPGPFWG